VRKITHDVPVLNLETEKAVGSLRSSTQPDMACESSLCIDKEVSLSRHEDAARETSTLCSGVVALAALTALQVANFALTANPYASLHSGHVNILTAEVVSELPALHLSTVIASALGLGIVWQCVKSRLKLEPWSIGLACIYTIASLLNGTYEDRPQTALYLAFLIVACGTLGKCDATRRIEGHRIVAAGLWLDIALAVLGVLLAVVSPGRFGIFSLEASRNARGEIALWIYTGVHYLPAALATGLFASREWRDFSLTTRVTTALLVSGVLIMHVGGAARNETFSFTVMLLCILVSRPILGWVVVPAMILVAIPAGPAITRFFFLANETDLADASNGRLELWSYFWDHIGDEPLVGVGDHFLARVADYGSGPNSEIGMLAIFTEKGWVFALALSFFLVRALCHGVVVLRQRTDPFHCAVAAHVIGLSTKFWIQGGSWPVADAMFWYGVAFLNSYRAPASSIPANAER
jgi:hypothetical protein